LSATDSLREDHKQIKRLEKIIIKCYNDLYDGKDIPLDDIEKINFIIAEFLDSIHYSREEDSYFPCVASYDHLKKEIRNLMIEHEFSRRIAKNISKHLTRWKNGEDAREPVARFLRTYSIYLMDHMSKEEQFFDKAENEVLSKEEEMEMFEQFRSVIAITTKMQEMIKEIEYLEKCPWILTQTL
jgi:hemerythrin-like domain-containing protein